MNDDVPRPMSPSKIRTDFSSEGSFSPAVMIDVQDESWFSCGDQEMYDALFAKALEAVLTEADHQLHPQTTIELSVLLTSNQAVQSLNKQYRGKDKPTNILSFESGLETPQPKGVPLSLGDLVLAFDVVQKEAEDQKKSFEQHLTHLVIHGLLHLLSYDHECDEEAAIMESLEIHILDFYFNLPNPYK